MCVFWCVLVSCANYTLLCACMHYVCMCELSVCVLGVCCVRVCMCVMCVCECACAHVCTWWVHADRLQYAAFVQTMCTSTATCMCAGVCDVICAVCDKVHCAMLSVHEV